MQYEQVYAWAKSMSLVQNKVSLLNWLLESPDGSSPVVLRYKRGHYNVYVAGSLFARVSVYDVASCDNALARLSALYDGLWFARRARCTFTVS